jgi:ADP-heptose:LPS heptosyltransferase
VLDLVPAQNILCIRGDRFGSFAVDVVRALARVRRARIDAVVDMEFFSRFTAIFAFLSGAVRRAGLHRFTAEAPYRGDLLTHRVQHNPYLHVSQAYRLLVEALWADPSDTPLMKARSAPPPVMPSFAPSEDERLHMRATLEAAAGGAVRGPLVLLNANTGDALPLRRWPVERFVELGRRVLDEWPDATLGLTGAPAERAAIETLRAQLGPRAVCLAGRTTLREVLVLYTLADVLVTNDSGPGHFASLTGVDSIVLFGPETPLVFGPLGPRSQAVTANLACSPCVNASNHRFSPCLHNACMHAISVDDVLTRVRAALDARAARAAAVRGAA